MAPSSPIVAPSILSADPGRYTEEIQSVVAAGADWIHIDVMDGSFVPPITFGDNIVRVARKACKLFLDVHLMIVEPERHLETFKAAGASRIVVHQEVCSHLHHSLTAIRALGIENGVAINPGTPVQTIFDALEVCDYVLVMTVNPGWGGQKFIDTCVPKIKELHEEISKRGLDTLISVDGGITDVTAKTCVAAGAGAVVAGSYIFQSSDRSSAIARLREAT